MKWSKGGIVVWVDGLGKRGERGGERGFYGWRYLVKRNHLEGRRGKRVGKGKEDFVQEIYRGRGIES